MIRGSSCRQKGFSLIEILIVVAIMVTMMGMFVSRMSFSDGAKITTAVMNFSRTIKTAYNYAIIHKKPYRIAIDLTKQEYWLEKSDKLQLLSTSKIDKEIGERELALIDIEKKKELDNMRETYGKSITKQDDDGKDVVLSYDSPLLKTKERQLAAKYTKETVPDISDMKLPDAIQFLDVQAQHNSTKIEAPRETVYEEGDSVMAYIYVLPNGFVERAVIHMGDLLNRENTNSDYTIVTNPLNGSTEIIKSFKEISFEEKHDDE